MICILISAIIAFVKSVLIVMYNVMCLECIQSCVCVCVCVCGCVCDGVVCVCEVEKHADELRALPGLE